jgi:hypothetical protein
VLGQTLGSITLQVFGVNTSRMVGSWNDASYKPDSKTSSIDFLEARFWIITKRDGS